MNSPTPVLLALGLLAGCVSTPEVYRDAPVSEVAAMAESEDPDDRRIDDINSWSNPDNDHEDSGFFGSFVFEGGDEDYQSETTSSETFGYHDDLGESTAEVSIRTHNRVGPDWSGSDWDQGYLWAGRRAPDTTRWSKYTTGWGWELGVAGLGLSNSVNASAYVLPVSFEGENAQSLDDPWLIAWELSLNMRYPVTEHVSLSTGAGLGSGLMLWDYANPLIDGDEEIASDSIGFFSLVMPLSLQSHYGPVMTELVATPTVRLAGDRTQAGFNNDITRVHTGIPITLRLGVVF
ncbi:hypothetical protein [Saccharospirillum salsuginis]|uniref:Uncharacterized protein n=1 Tax=Saccharospirillum salsuginis TaxID=418750 RepID=A0A918K738_9GAMM|nr:hypothetical protein [Saccharospirillum salsuginis]GGX49071.1 hypothetical protein GCM10007392_15420 [Saccharospirillum salsuginis]